MPNQRRKTFQVAVSNIWIGSDFPIVVQSMTNTPTEDITATTAQIIDLVNAGSECVRITINDDMAAKAVPEICQVLHEKKIAVPLIGDFHFNGHVLLSRYPQMAALLAKYRINPGNLGRGEKHDEHFETIINIAIKHHKPVRIGVNSGSLDPDLLAELIEKNRASQNQQSERVIFCHAMVQSALQSAQSALKHGLPENQIVLSAKTSDLYDLITIYQHLSQQCRYPLHVGLTEAGSQEEGIISTTAALSLLLDRGIGDTIRVSLTPDPQTPRTKEVDVARQILQSLGIQHFKPRVISCPGCGRTSPVFFQQLSHAVKQYIDQENPKWQVHHPDVCHMTVAVMGCVVNGPGESRHADIGISLPGHLEDPVAPVYIKGKLFTTLTGDDLDKQFLDILKNFVQSSY